MEKGFFGYDLNNNRNPDFENLGIELKVTGYKWVHKGKLVSAKERLVITMIDYFNDINVDFYSSHCYRKIENILLVLYEYEDDKNPYDFTLTNYYMYEYNNISPKDKFIIENDWKTIIDKIKDGKAHELSEGDTFYLGACPKGATKESVTRQPFSPEPAMKRAYSFKTTYMTYLFRTNVFQEIESRESFIKDLRQLKSHSLEDIIYDTFQPYKEKTLSEIDTLLSEPVMRENNKQYIRSYTSKMMNVVQNNLESLEEFLKANIQIKTIRINKHGRIKESMSFPAFNFVEVANETWENASIHELFASTKFLFVVFEEIDDTEKEYKFKGVKLWNMPSDIIETEIRQVWEQTNFILNNELILNIKNDKVMNNFPKASDNPISHVRPHAKNRSETSQLPNSTKIVIESNDNTVDLSIYFDEHQFTKQCFWLNSDYVLSILKDLSISNQIID